MAIQQTAYNQQALIMLQPELSWLEEVFARQQRGEPDQELSLSPAAPIFLEQNIQLMLLGIMALSLSGESVAVLIDCLESSNALVVESAEHLLAKLGREVVGELKAAARQANGQVLKARLLDVGRSISASEVVDLARDNLNSDNPLLCAVAAKTIGEAGQPPDATAIRERFGQVDELTDVCILQALASLDADSHADSFAEALGSLYPGTRWAAWNGVCCCSSEVIDEYLPQLTRSANAFQRLEGRGSTGPLSALFSLPGAAPG